MWAAFFWQRRCRMDRYGIDRGTARLVLALAVVAVASVALASPADAVTIKQVTSPGGITAWLVEDHSLPVVTVDVGLPRRRVRSIPPTRPGLPPWPPTFSTKAPAISTVPPIRAGSRIWRPRPSSAGDDDFVDLGLRTITANLGAVASISCASR